MKLTMITINLPFLFQFYHLCFMYFGPLLYGEYTFMMLNPLDKLTVFSGNDLFSHWQYACPEV